MKLEYVNLDAMPKLNRPTKLQAVLYEFMASCEKAARCVFNKEEYANPSSEELQGSNKPFEVSHCCPYCKRSPVFDQDLTR